MQLEVGQQIGLQGKTWLVFEIERSETTFIADKTSDETRAGWGAPINVKVVDQQVDEFGPGDIVELQLEVVQLIIPGQHVFFIYNKRYYRRIKSAAKSANEATSGAPQSTKLGPSGGIRNGREGIGETGGAQDRDGSVGDGGDTLCTGGRQGVEHPVAERGGGDAAGDRSEPRQPVAEGGQSVAELLAKIRARSRAQS